MEIYQRDRPPKDAVAIDRPLDELIATYAQIEATKPSQPDQFATRRNTRALDGDAFHELSLIFSEYNGQVWSPRNPDAKVLGVKGRPEDVPGALTVGDYIRGRATPPETANSVTTVEGYLRGLSAAER